MSDFEGNPFSNDGSGSIDDALSQLFECSPTVGENVVCDKCHSDYTIQPALDETQEPYPNCPHCSNQPDRFSLTRVRLEKVKSQIGWKTASSRAREWWTALESKHSLQLDCVLSLAVTLATKKATIEEFYGTYLRSGALGVSANLLFMDFLRERAMEISSTVKSKEAQQFPQLPKVILMGIPASAEHGIAISLMTYGNSKIEVIKVVKRFSEMTLLEIKLLVESVPAIIGCCASEADAQIVVAQINAAGGHAYVCEVN